MALNNAAFNIKKKSHKCLKFNKEKRDNIENKRRGNNLKLEFKEKNKLYIVNADKT